MKLYYSTGACSLSPHIALRGAGLAFEPVLASTKTHQSGAPNVVAHHERVAARPAVREALQVEGLLGK